MAIFKKIAASGKYQDNQAIPDLITYITSPAKTPSNFIDGIGISGDDIAGSMVAVSETFAKNSKIRLHHFVVSFYPWEIKSLGNLVCVAQGICTEIGKEHQIIYAFHEDKDHPHLHFIFNAVSYVDGHRYRGGIKEYNELFALVRNAVRYFLGRDVISVNYKPQNGNPHE